jgi:hypothetical protein
MFFLILDNWEWFVDNTITNLIAIEIDFYKVPVITQAISSVYHQSVHVD